MSISERNDKSNDVASVRRLEIFTGVGRVLGVTTAATLWVTTVVGLCFGGGQLFLGSAGTVLAVVVLTALRSIENFISREHRALLIVKTCPRTDVEDIVLPILKNSSIEAKFISSKYGADDAELACL